MLLRFLLEPISLAGRRPGWVGRLRLLRRVAGGRSRLFCRSRGRSVPSLGLSLIHISVRMDDTKPYVYQVVDGELKRRDVEVSLQNLTRVEISGGLSENAVVALSSADTKPLTDGARIKVVP